MNRTITQPAFNEPDGRFVIKVRSNRAEHPVGGVLLHRVEQAGQPVFHRNFIIINKSDEIAFGQTHDAIAHEGKIAFGFHLVESFQMIFLAEFGDRGFGGSGNIIVHHDN